MAILLEIHINVLIIIIVFHIMKMEIVQSVKMDILLMKKVIVHLINIVMKQMKMQNV